MRYISSSLPFRQIHLDFHNSELIPDIGKKFDKTQFQETLKLGFVNSINLFAKCHHGLSYHPTNIGQQHPNLTFDLFGEQIEACQEIGVEVIAYISAGFDEYYLRQSPGDMVMSPDGYDPLNTGYDRLCFNSPYLKHLCLQVVEILKNYKVSGVWSDIVGLAPCVCRRCRYSMVDVGLDPTKNEDIMKFASQIQKKYFQLFNEAVLSVNADAMIFHNQGHIPKGDHNAMDAVTHLELESLPTGGWGYDHFPLSARYALTQDRAVIGMTGKFHTTWGEFGGFKHPNALRYETSAMLAYGSSCCIGDQLHPEGILNIDTYTRIGQAYEEVFEKEAFCRDAKPVSEIAMLAIESLHSGRVMDAHLADRDYKEDTGCSRVLLESQIMFDVIDTEVDFNKYKLIIIPDTGRLSEALASKFKSYLKQGGKLLLSGQSGMKLDSDQFWFDLPSPEGRSGTDMEYMQLSDDFRNSNEDGLVVATPFVIEGNNFEVRAPEDAQCLAKTILPYFTRSLCAFTSHQHAPDAKESDFSAAFMKDSLLYFAPELFSQYARRAQLIYREVLKMGIEALLGYLPTRTSLPSAGRVCLMHQKQKNRLILHLMYANPIKRGDAVFPRWGIKSIEVIEDIPEFYNVDCELTLSEKKICRVCLVPSQEEIPFVQSESTIKFKVPRVECHQMVELVYQ